MPQVLTWVPPASPCSENAPSLLMAPPVSPLEVHFPCATVKTWPGWSPAGILCMTSGLPHLPENEALLCAEAIATTKANSTQTHRMRYFIRNLLLVLDTRAIVRPSHAKLRVIC